MFQIHEENKASCALMDEVTLKSTSTCGQGDLNPDPLYSWYHFSHPPLVRPPRCFTFWSAAISRSSGVEIDPDHLHGKVERVRALKTLDTDATKKTT